MLLVTVVLIAFVCGGHATPKQQNMTADSSTRSSRSRLDVNENNDDALLERLQMESHGDLIITFSRATNNPSFIRVSKNGDLSNGAAQRGSRSHAARDFLHDYGKLFGIKNAATELDEVSSMTDEIGMTHLTYKQMYQGVPVYGAVLKSHFDSDDHLTAVNGLFVPDIDSDLDVVPTFGNAKAQKSNGGYRKGL